MARPPSRCSSGQRLQVFGPQRNSGSRGPNRGQSRTPQGGRLGTWDSAWRAQTYLRPLPPGDSTVGWSRSGTRYRRRSRPRDQRSLGYRQLGSGRCQHVGDVAANAGWSPEVCPNWWRSGYAAPGDQPEVAAGGSLAVVPSKSRPSAVVLRHREAGLEKPVNSERPRRREGRRGSWADVPEWEPASVRRTSGPGWRGSRNPCRPWSNLRHESDPGARHLSTRLRQMSAQPLTRVLGRDTTRSRNCGQSPAALDVLITRRLGKVLGLRSSPASSTSRDLRQAARRQSSVTGSKGGERQDRSHDTDGGARGIPEQEAPPARTPEDGWESHQSAVWTPSNPTVPWSGGCPRRWRHAGRLRDRRDRRAGAARRPSRSVDRDQRGGHQCGVLGIPP